MAALVAEAPPHMLRMQVQPAQPLRILSGGLAGQVNSRLASRDSGQGCGFYVSWTGGHDGRAGEVASLAKVPAVLPST